MIKIRSASLFRLLCLAIGGLAVALLAMVVLMVRPVVFGGESAGVAAGPVGPATPKKSAPVAVARNLATWHDLVSPPAPRPIRTSRRLRPRTPREATSSSAASGAGQAATPFFSARKTGSSY